MEKGWGSYFLTNLYADIDSLHLSAGIHSKPYKHYHRLLSRRFPFAVFYTYERTHFSFMRCWTADAIQRGYVDDFFNWRYSTLKSHMLFRDAFRAFVAFRGRVIELLVKLNQRSDGRAFDIVRS
jgi:hypothetical protein